jgi:hypothetical protein
LYLFFSNVKKTVTFLSRRDESPKKCVTLWRYYNEW